MKNANLVLLICVSFVLKIVLIHLIVPVVKVSMMMEIMAVSLVELNVLHAIVNIPVTIALETE